MIATNGRTRKPLQEGTRRTNEASWWQSCEIGRDWMSGQPAHLAGDWGRSPVAWTEGAPTGATINQSMERWSWEARAVASILNLDDSSPECPVTPRTCPQPAVS